MFLTDLCVMNQLPDEIDGNDFQSFNSDEDFISAFRKMNDEDEKDDDFIVEGNSSLKFSSVKQWVEYFGVKNVYFQNDCLENRFCDEFFIDVKNANHKGWSHFAGADEISMHDGYLRKWFD